jgi:ligand-binding SRPBCC domain-containing protein
MVTCSATGDFDDVKVVAPYGEILWTRLSRISDDEMKALMIEVTNKVFTFLTHAEHLMTLGSGLTDLSQKIMVPARAMAEKKALGHPS